MTDLNYLERAVSTLAFIGVRYCISKKPLPPLIIDVIKGWMSRLKHSRFNAVKP